MKISNLILGSFIALSSVAAFSLAAKAGQTCRKDYLGEQFVVDTKMGIGLIQLQEKII